MRELQEVIGQAVKDLFQVEVNPELSRPAEEFGEYSTNVALQLAAKLNKKPAEIAQVLLPKLQSVESVAEASLAGPGFINIRLSDQALMAMLASPTAPPQSYKNKVVVAEYSDPNPFKVLHAGHLYTSIVGDAVARLLENAGATVHRVNFGGDVGLHVAKTMWAILQSLAGENPERLSEIPAEKRADWMADCYVKGTAAYDENESIKAEITNLNKSIYELHEKDERNSPLAQIYWTCRDWSYEYFEQFYQEIGTTKFDKYYPESSTAATGLKVVKEQLAKGVFEQSKGAVIFRGEKYGLHDRVFITTEGLPTYETKDIGLIIAKHNDYHFDQSIVITGNEILEYMRVVLKAVEQFEPDLAKKTSHLTHGIVKLAGGQKMSSRIGNILKAEEVLFYARQAGQKITNQDNKDIALAAVKYAFLRQRLGGIFAEFFGRAA